jgi:glycosyltransferase involved in cell wall biosynthesis
MARKVTSKENMREYIPNLGNTFIVYSLRKRYKILNFGNDMRVKPPFDNFDNTLKIIVCIPAYNESKNISNIVQKARSYATEVIVCDDGSFDDTVELARAAGATIVKHTFNRGYGAAINTLFQIAKEKKADVMITIDSDGQHDPTKIPDIISPILNDGFDIVIGSRFINQQDRLKVPGYRTLGIKTITRLAQIFLRDKNLFSR